MKLDIIREIHEFMGSVPMSIGTQAIHSYLTGRRSGMVKGWWMLEGINHWLVVWLPFFLFPLILGIIIPIDFHIFLYWESHHPNWRTHIFQMGWNHQPVSVRIILMCPDRWINVGWYTWRTCSWKWQKNQALICPEQKVHWWFQIIKITFHEKLESRILTGY